MTQSQDYSDILRQFSEPVYLPHDGVYFNWWFKIILNNYNFQGFRGCPGRVIINDRLKIGLAKSQNTSLIYSRRTPSQEPTQREKETARWWVSYFKLKSHQTHSFSDSYFRKKLQQENRLYKRWRRTFFWKSLRVQSGIVCAQKEESRSVLKT